jgi:hypothetical protein
MGLWAQGSGQYLDCTSLANSFAAFDALVHSVIGEGVITGLDFSVVSGAAVQCSVGTAVAGHIVALNVAQNISFAAGTWDVYLCQPVFTYSGTAPIAASYPGANGYDAGVLTAVVSGTKPAALGALLATIVSTGAAISSINNTPTGRVTLPLVSAKNALPGAIELHRAARRDADSSCLYTFTDSNPVGKSGYLQERYINRPFYVHRIR